MVSLMLFLPFFSAITLLFMGRLIGRFGAFLISVGCIFSSFFLGCYFFVYTYTTNHVYYFTFGKWIDYVGTLSVGWDFQFDLLSLLMVITVTFISGLVHVYSWGYMETDPFLIRFFGLLSLFTFFMLVLVTSANFLVLFVGWEGIGACSYFLIGFWYTRVQANKSALKAMIVNRIGDIAFLIAISIIAFFFKTLDFSTVFLLIPIFTQVTFEINTYTFNVIEFISFWFAIAAIGKSAQIGLHTWLPDAMEGPTPVSALIHAATMVTAGIFLIIRCSFIFEYAPNTLIFLTFVGSTTAIFAASTGLVQNDIKKVIAYSTCSQLGYMMCACGLSNYSGSFFHLVNHAFFKALLFLSAGSVIHAMSNEQDMRKMGSLKSLLPVTYISMIIGSLALIGWPFLSGYYSKDFILETALINYTISGSFSLWLLTLTATLTGIYSIRLIYLVFISSASGYKTIFSKIHESNWFILSPLVILSLASIFFGYNAKDLFIGSGTSTWNNVIYNSIYNNLNLIDVENLFFLKILPICFSFGAVAIFLVLFFSFNYFKFVETTPVLITKSLLLNFLSNKWYFDYIYNTFFLYFYQVCYSFWVVLDKGILEITQPISFTTNVNSLSNTFNLSLNKNVNFYLFSSFFIIFFCILLYILI